MSYVIETHELTKCFGRKQEAVRNLSLAVPEGSIFAYLGPNGAGKTTTIKLIVNILSATEGSSRVLGVDSRELGPQQFAQIGFVAEDQTLPGWMTVGAFIAYCKPMYPTWDDAFCTELLRQFDLPIDRKLKHLSRGMRMKVALLSSLAYRPRLLILDEPFSGLDPLVRDEFIRAILELTEQEHWTVFISSHDIDEVERLADWVGVIDRGTLRQAESTRSLQERFRKVELVVPLASDGVPPDLPPAWLLAEQAGHTVRFMDSAYDERATAEAVAQRFPEGTRLSASALSLREIFMALARTYRANQEERV